MALLDLFNMKYPSTDFHELNLDWCISAVLQLQKAFEDFSAGNKIIFADPLQHDLNSSYAKNTIVIDASGTAYLSLQTVPKGVQLSNASYWLPVFDFAGYIMRANKNFTDNYFSDTTRAPYALEIGDWLVLDDVLYKVTADIAADDLFIVDTNIVHFTVEQFLKDFVTTVNQTLADWYLEMNGKINQYKNDIDASELAYKNEVNAHVDEVTASLQAQLNAAISGATVDSEVINARIGANGVTYSTLGEAIRTQLLQIDDSIDLLDSLIYSSTNLFKSAQATNEGYYNSLGVWVDTNALLGMYIKITPGQKYTISGTYTYSAALDINKTWIASYMNTSNPYTFTAPSNAEYLYVSASPTGNLLYLVNVNEGENVLPLTEGYTIPVMANKGLQYGEVNAGSTDFATTGSQLIDPTHYETGCYYSSTTGRKILTPSYSSVFVVSKEGVEYTLTGSAGHLSFFTSDMNFISGVVLDGTAYTFTTPDHTKFICISIETANEGSVRLNKGDTDLGYEPYKIIIPNLVNPDFFDYTKYNYPYIRDMKVLCNKASETVTAYYAAVDCGEKVNTIAANWIWESGSTSGTVALITNKNGADRVSDITDLSLHLVLDNEHVKVDVLGDIYGTRYYQTIINETFATPMALDGETVHDIIFAVNTATNKVNVYIDNNTYVYEGTFVPDANISGLDDVIGRYATFEHYTATNRDLVAMPMFTYFYCRDVNNVVKVKDYFDRQDGQLSTTPQGQTYHLMSTAHYIG